MTVGWIRESDEDRFYEATLQVPGPARADSSLPQCPFCHESFASVRELYDHLHQQHVLPRPILLISGSEPATHDLVAEALSASDIALLNCSQVLLGLDADNLQQCTVEAFQKVLARKRSGTARIRLLSGTGALSPVSQDYILRFRVASRGELARVDRLFVNYLGKSQPHLSAVAEFLQKTGEGVWGEYARALADYVVGVLTKDKDPATGVQPPFPDYAEHFRRSCSILDKYDRPLPFLLRSIIRFALNDFERAGGTGFDDLDNAACLLRQISHNGDGGAVPAGETGWNGEVKPVCPLDAGTSQVLAASRQILSLQGWSSSETEMLESIDRTAALGTLDKPKLMALTCWAALKFDQRERAIPLLQRLTGNDQFARWAESVLEGLA